MSCITDPANGNGQAHSQIPIVDYPDPMVAIVTMFVTEGWLRPVKLPEN
jgi:hypothetical protein